MLPSTSKHGHNTCTGEKKENKTGKGQKHESNFACLKDLHQHQNVLEILDGQKLEHGVALMTQSWLSNIIF